MALTQKLKKEIFEFLQQHRSPDLLTAYFFYLEKQFHIEPVVFLQDKMIFQSASDAMKKLESENKIWRETEIKIGYGPQSVNELTKRIYICPFTGKVFGDNTHPNPQDAIYDWVERCPENKERVDGVKAKRFHVSDDLEVIRNYIKPRKEPITKIVYSSAVSGKLYNSKESVVRDFKQNYLKSMPLVDVQNQNRFVLEDDFLHFIEEHLQESKITTFVEVLADDDLFAPYVNRWVEA